MIVYDYPTSTEEGVFPTRKDEKGMVRNESISGINQGRTLTLKGRALTLHMKMQRQRPETGYVQRKTCSQSAGYDNGFLDVVNSQSAMKAEDGMDVRNYGGLDGIPEAKKLMADILEVKTRERDRMR